MDKQTYPTHAAARAAAEECRGWYDPRALIFYQPECVEADSNGYVHVVAMQTVQYGPLLFMRTDGYVR